MVCLGAREFEARKYVSRLRHGRMHNVSGGGAVRLDATGRRGRRQVNFVFNKWVDPFAMFMLAFVAIPALLLEEEQPNGQLCST